MALFAGLLFGGLFAGFLLAVLILEASLRRFPVSVYTQVRQVELAHLDDLATVLLDPLATPFYFIGTSNSVTSPASFIYILYQEFSVTLIGSKSLGRTGHH